MSLQQFDALASGIAHGLSRKLGLHIRIESGAVPNTDLEKTLTLPPPTSHSEKDLAAWHGLADHECAHVLYTDKTALEGLTKDEAMTLNVLEDCTVSHKISQEYKGTGHNIRSAYSQIAEDMASKPMTPKCALYCGAMLGADPVTHAALAALQPADAQAQAEFARGKAFGERNRDKILNRERTADLIPLARELIEGKDSNQPQDKPDKGEGDGDEGKPNGDGKGSGKGKGKGDGEGKETGNGSGKGDSDNKEGEGEQEGKEERSPGHGACDDSDAPPTMERLGKKIADKGSRMARTQGGVARLYKHNKIPCVPQQGALTVGRMGRGLAGELRIAVQTRTNRRRIGNQDDGSDLDDDVLPDLARRQPDLHPYESRTRAMYPDTAIVLVLDGSGSMSSCVSVEGVTESYTSMFHCALGAGYAIAQGLALVPRTKFAVWTNDRHEREEIGAYQLAYSKVQVLSDFGKRPNEQDLGSWCRVSPAAGTECWGSCIRRATRELLKQKVKRRVVLLVTDGGLTGADTHRPSDITLADTVAQAHGVEVYGVAWGPSAYWNNSLPTDRVITESEVSTPSRDWLRKVSKLLLKGST